MPKLPAFEDWKWPWAAGEIEEEKAARLIWNARRSEEAAADKVKGKDDEIAQLKTDLDDVKAAKSGTDTESQDELKNLRKKVRELEDTAGKPNPAQQREIDRLSVALKLGLSEADSKRLVGETLEEIEADAKVFAGEHGIELPSDGSNEDTDGNEPPRRQPERRQPLRDGFGTGGRVVREDVNKVLADLPPLR